MVDIFIVDGQSAGEVEDQLQKFREQVRNVSATTVAQTNLSVVTFRSVSIPCHSLIV